MATNLSDNTSLEQSALISARSCTAQQNYGRAFANYLVVLKLNPHVRHEIKSDFVFVMKEWADELEEGMRLGDLFKCYDLACELFPDCEGMLNNIGAQLFRLGYKDEGVLYVRRALKINPEFIAARENLENICSHLVERWHFRMLNDSHRNSAFYRAIGLAVLQGYDTVLDIGSGTGLLSMFAATHGALVTACEHSKTMAMISEEVLAANHLLKSVKVINKNSTDLTVPDDIQKVSLVVTETFDAGLFGERVLSTLKHAWNELLLPSPAPDELSLKPLVIPQKATLFVCAVECDAILKQSRFMYPSLKALDMSSAIIKCTTTVDPDEPYTTENLNELNGGYKKLSSDIPFLTVNFNDIQNITYLLSGDCHFTFQLPIKTRGRVDALTMWFDLHLCDDIHLDTSPQTPNCWQQAVFPVSCDNNRCLTVHSGQAILIDCECGNDKINLKYSGIEPRHSLSTDNTHTLDSMMDGDNGDVDDCVVICGESGEKIRQKSQRNIDIQNVKPNLDAKECQNNAGQDIHVLENVLKNTHVGLDSGRTDLDSDEPMNLKIICGSSSEVDKRDGYSIPGNRNSSHTNCVKMAEIPGGKLKHYHHENIVVAPNHIRNIDGKIHTNYCANIENDYCSSIDSKQNRPINSQHHVAGSQSIDSKQNQPINAQHHEPGSQSNDSKQNQPINSLHHEPGSQSNDSISKTFHFSRDEIGRLNDIHLNSKYCEALTSLADKHSNQGKKPLRIADITHGLSTLGLQAMKLGFDHATIYASNQHERSLLEYLMELNEIPEEKVAIVESASCLSKGNKYDVIVGEIIEPCGVLKQQILEDIDMYRETSLCLGGLILPSHLTVYGLCIESFDLIRLSRVENDSVTLGYTVARFINDFQMSTHVGINLSTLNHRKLTEPFQLLQIDLNENHADLDLPSFLDLDEKVAVKVTESGQLSAVVFWFEITILDDMKVCTYDGSSHWKQAAIMIPGEKSLNSGGVVQVNGRLKNSCIDIRVLGAS